MHRIVSLAVVYTLFAASAFAADDPKPLKVLLIAGGCCHDYNIQKDLLKQGIEARAHATVDIVYTPDTTTKARFEIYENPNWAAGYDVVIHDECTSDVKDLPYVRNILNAHRQGTPAVLLHCAMHCYRTGTDDWFEFCGIQSSRHGPKKPIEVVFIDQEHPITRGLKGWATGDEELYNNLKLFDTAKPLARGTQDTGQQVDDFVVAWTNDYHGTRVFSTTLGHNNALVGDPRYLDLVTRGLLWATNKLDDAYLKKTAAATSLYQGFGAHTPGGAGQEVVRVTTLADSGPGSLREALSKGNRTVVFDVAGTIELARRLEVRGSHVTIDGLTAPSPGVTLVNDGLVIRGTLGAHDVIVRGIRVHNAPDDGIQVAHDAYNVVLDRVAVHGAGDGSIDITHGAHDVTVCWSLLSHPASNKNMLIKYGARRVTLHHNLFVGSTNRNPQISNGTETGFTAAEETIADMRNNLVCAWGGGEGVRVRDGARANLVNNYFLALGGDKRDAVVVEPQTQGQAYIAGNQSADRLPIDPNTLSTEPGPFIAPVVETAAASVAAEEVLARAGVRPLDELDQQSLSAVQLPAPKPATAVR